MANVFGKLGNSNKKSITPYIPAQPVDTNAALGPMTQQIIDTFNSRLGKLNNNTGYSSGGGGGGGGPSYFDPGPYLPPINTGPSFEEIDAAYKNWDLQGQGVDITQAKNQADYQSILAGLGLSDTSAQQTAAYQRGTLGNQLGSAKLSWEKQLSDLLSNATGAGAITSKGYSQNVGYANQGYNLAGQQNTLDLSNVGNQLQQALAGNQLQRTQAGQDLGFSGQQNTLQKAMLGNQRLQYDAGLRTQNQQNIARQGQYDTQYNYTPYNQVRAYGTQG